MKDTTIPIVNMTNQQDKIDTAFSKITEVLMTIYVLFCLCIFPTVTHDKYADILVFRFALFWKSTLLLIAIFVALGIAYLVIKKVKIKEVLFFKKGFILHVWKKSSTPDKLFFLLMIEMCISTIFAPYVYEAFWGNLGRRQGFFAWIFFYANYLLITRFYKPKTWHIYPVLIASLCPCIWGILNFFMIDPFGFKTNIDEFYTHTFASSIGNINTYSNYTGMMLALSTTIFIVAKNKGLTAVSFIIMVVHCFAHIMSISDNTLLSVAAIYMALPFIAWNSDERFLRYFVAIFIFLFSDIITGDIFIRLPDTMNESGNSILISIGLHTYVRILTISLGIIILLLVIIKYKNNKLFSEQVYRILRKVWTLCLVLSAVAVVSLLIIVNTKEIPTFLVPYKKILIFNDNWGTNRGLVWRLAFKYYFTDSTLVQKLFGNGPDTFYIIMMDRYREELVALGSKYDSAHNEYIEYLMTIGVFGIILYGGLLISSIKNGLKDSKIFVMSSGVAILAYAIQASVNIAIPITTPIFITLLAISSLKNKIKTKDYEEILKNEGGKTLIIP